jgi:voltage-gated potassium channel
MDDLETRRQFAIHPQFELLILGMSVLQLINSVLLVFLKDAEIVNIVWTLIYGTSLFLLFEFFYRLLKFPGKKGEFLFGKLGWLNLVGSLPVPGLVLARLGRTAWILRHLRSSDYKDMLSTFAQERAQGTFVAILLLSLLVLEIAAIGVLHYEQTSPQANIQTGQDALWWGYVTIATVGYGDRYPVTTMGRVVGIFTMTVGVGLFSVVTGFLADWFRQSSRRRKRLVAMDGQMQLRDHLQELHRLLDEQEKSNAQVLEEIREKLRQVENLKI